MNNNLEFTEEELIQIKTAANLLFPPSEIAIMLGIAEEHSSQFIKMCNNQTIGGEVYKNYQSGKFEQELVVRKSILLSAKNGSPPAQSMAEKMLLNLKMNEK